MFKYILLIGAVGYIALLISTMWQIKNHGKASVSFIRIIGNYLVIGMILVGAGGWIVDSVSGHGSKNTAKSNQAEVVSTISNKSNSKLKTNKNVSHNKKSKFNLTDSSLQQTTKSDKTQDNLVESVKSEQSKVSDGKQNTSVKDDLNNSEQAKVSSSREAVTTSVKDNLNNSEQANVSGSREAVNTSTSRSSTRAYSPSNSATERYLIGRHVSSHVEKYQSPTESTETVEVPNSQESQSSQQ
ncbi:MULTISPECIES: hypothetical protein [Lactobacillus]|uniref:Uncharacterized protein n=1 Tax=Lactobacillus xujianguonis TaxID=2495899 RepID=A0A437SY62_9LACO|nr:MULTISPECIES: hypothetical protein [Lactobacillus]RVU71856.1 hypothetical protein EJK17_00845 [Lactobacillus xujianguonis]RVU77632.1 hypothetical protein EJK20_01375 [Lactobacillus xujianguonis]